MKRYRTMTNVKSTDDPDGVVEQIGHCVGYSPDDEERILSSIRVGEPQVVLDDVDDLFGPDLDEMDGPSDSDLAEIDGEAA